MTQLWWNHLIPIFAGVLVIGMLGAITGKLLLKEGRGLNVVLTLCAIFVLTPWIIAGVKWYGFYRITSRQEDAISELKALRSAREKFASAVITDLEKDPETIRFINDVHSSNKGSFSPDEADVLYGRVVAQVQITANRLGIRFQPITQEDLVKKTIQESSDPYRIDYTLETYTAGNCLRVGVKVDIRLVRTLGTDYNHSDYNNWGTGGRSDFYEYMTEIGLGGPNHYLRFPNVALYWNWNKAPAPVLESEFITQFE